MSASLTSEVATRTESVTPYISATITILSALDANKSKARLSPQAISKNATEELGRYLNDKSATMVLRYLDRFISRAATKTPGCYSVDAQRRLVIDSERFLEELEDTFADLPANFYENFQGDAIGEWAMPKALDAYTQMKWTSFQGSLANTGRSGSNSSHTHHQSDSDDDSDDSGDEYEVSRGYLKPSKPFSQEEAGMLEEMIANGTAGKEQVLRLSRQVSDKRWHHPGGKARNPKLRNDQDVEDDEESDTDEDEWSVQRYQEEHNARRKGRLSVDHGVTL